MSWFFGKKKHHKESPPESSDETLPNQGDDFIFIERRGNPGPELPSDRSSQPSGGLYPVIDNIPYNPTPIPTNFPKQTAHNENQNYLQGVPFKLCKHLDNTISGDSDIDMFRVNEILSFIVRLENEDFTYDFTLETSVANEMDSRTE
ncbi:uncharacterized protein LOC107266852 [Cephus cinctus]|uniref:Uncharacterized protein LOC107266852 n=1 Tax=Cephus cinctus TaxID=211228 RepID=A0AAJ7BT37_CEPCN|nr:uncharacterized protein LOC107266852 [Cephus cinctus]XP_015593281.1 uncharacterized protein LOC107266852 [Cephus cinctus]XP_015593282.1 uncharacterized protein LOC107266852 [Cephus cinctus]XP_015593283.1 uncharacterized protein LOC107266852 [Cephus cinctus]